MKMIMSTLYALFLNSVHAKIKPHQNEVDSFEPVNVDGDDVH